MSKYILIRIPFRSLAYFRKVGSKVIDHLETKYKWPIIVIANRTIQSKRGKPFSPLIFLKRANEYNVLTFI